MKTIRIVHEGPAGSRVRAAGVLFQDVGGCWHAYVPSLGLCGYGWSRQAAYASLEVMVRVYLRVVKGISGLLEDVREGGWGMESGEWFSPLMTYAQLREVLGCKRRGGVIRTFGLLVEAGSRLREQRIDVYKKV